MINDTMEQSKLQKFTKAFKETTIAFSQSELERAREVVFNSEFPTTRNENWKYTRLGKLQNLELQNNAPLQKFKVEPLSENSIQFIFENGHLISGNTNSLPDGIEIQLLSKCSQENLSKFDDLNNLNKKDLFYAMNTLYCNNGLFIKIKSKQKIERTIEIIHVQSSQNSVSHFKNLIIAEAFSEAHIVERFLSDNSNSSFCNSINELKVEDNAHLTFDKIQYENPNAISINSDLVEQQKNSTFTINTFTLNGLLVRNNLNIEVKGENSITYLNGAYLLKNNQHVDNHTIVDHLAPNCESHELYKGIIDDSATAVFNGKVFVRKDSQKINAFQSNANILLTDTATINSKPELEIYADDVKCSHGSTTGQLDDEAIFYLRARGISAKSAKELLVSAFISDVLNHVKNEDVNKHLNDLISKEFGWEI